MEPYYFGPGAQLFGAFHSPIGAMNNKGVVIVPPLFNDYMRSHRVLRQVAFKLSKRGFAVLRFDLRGTGNSFGDIADLKRSDWVEDVAYAIDELREVGTVDRIATLGVRYSSHLVEDAALQSSFGEAVLWDPPPPERPLFDAERASQNAEVEFQGFRLGQVLVDSWNETASSGKAPALKRTLVLTSGQHRETADRVCTVEIDCAWDKGHLDEPIYSRDLVDSLCNAF